jgi:hypothetical protein
MEQSLFLEWVRKYFPGLTIAVVETLNGVTYQPTYLHRRLLKKDFSVTGKWESLSAAFSLVMADVVAMDSSLPLKKRDVISKASGDIPKQGMELKLNERQLTDLDTLIAMGGTNQQVVAKLFADVPRVIGGIYERNEAMFLEGLSTGVTLVDDTETTGTGVRLDFGYLTANKFGVAATVWSNTAAVPFDDIQRLVNKASADGNTIVRCFMDRTAFNNLAATTQAKSYYAFQQGFTGSNTIAPDLASLNTVFNARFAFPFELVDRSVKMELNGVQTSSKPWQDGMCVFVCSNQIGALAYARLAEQNHPVAGVEYNTVDDFLLVSKYRKNTPSLSEYTSSQARVVPVISDVARIYTLDSKTVIA